MGEQRQAVAAAGSGPAPLPLLQAGARDGAAARHAIALLGARQTLGRRPVGTQVNARCGEGRRQLRLDGGQSTRAGVRVEYNWRSGAQSPCGQLDWRRHTAREMAGPSPPAGLPTLRRAPIANQDAMRDFGPRLALPGQGGASARPAAAAAVAAAATHRQPVMPMLSDCTIRDKHCACKQVIGSQQLEKTHAPARPQQPPNPGADTAGRQTPVLAAGASSRGLHSSLAHAWVCEGGALHWSSAMVPSVSSPAPRIHARPAGPAAAKRAAVATSAP